MRISVSALKHYHSFLVFHSITTDLEFQSTNWSTVKVSWAAFHDLDGSQCYLFSKIWSNLHVSIKKPWQICCTMVITMVKQNCWPREWKTNWQSLYSSAYTFSFLLCYWLLIVLIITSGEDYSWNAPSRSFYTHYKLIILNDDNPRSRRIWGML